MKKKIVSRSGLISMMALLCVPFSVLQVHAETGTGLHSPEVVMQQCDTVYFGSYWQEDTNGDGVADQRDDKTPIRWRILSQKGNDAYVMADRVLDCQPYNKKEKKVTWASCSLRKWLNQSFYQAAFSKEEQSAILQQTVANPDNASWETDGGKDTTDQVYLASIDDLETTAFGFCNETVYGNDQAKIGLATAYAKAQGAETNGERMADWWLRTPGKDSRFAATVLQSIDGEGRSVGSRMGIRPVLHINLSSAQVKKGEQIGTAIRSVKWDTVEFGTNAGKPMLWRVLEVSRDTAYLLSEEAVVNRQYHDQRVKTTWKDCSLRKWLNGAFYDSAFSEKEKAAIVLSPYGNAVDPRYEYQAAGEDTQDKLALLSIGEAMKTEYGFPMYGECGNASRTLKDAWWLRTLSTKGMAVFAVSGGDGGNIYCNQETPYLDDSLGVRPVLHVSVSAASLQKKGSVSAVYPESEKRTVTLNLQDGTAPSYMLGTKPFFIRYTCNSDGKLTFKSSNKKVAAVSAKGKLTIKGTGRAKITIQTKETAEFKAGKQILNVTVYDQKSAPEKVQLQSAKLLKKNGKYYVSCKWDSISKMDGFRLCYSPKKNFDGYGIVTKKIKKGNEALFPVSYSKGKLYVKVCAYRKVKGDEYNGKWSKTIKVK